MSGDGHTRDEADRLDRGSDVARLSDAALVVGIAIRDHDAFAEVYSRHGAAVQALAGRVCGPNQADEFVQEVFLRLWHQPESFDPERSTLRNFPVMQAYGRAVELVHGDAALQSPLQEADLTRSRRGTADVKSAAVDDDAASKPWRLLSRLPEGERDAIALAYYGGYTYRQVAELLDEPEKTIKNQIRSGLLHLRSLLA